MDSLDRSPTLFSSGPAAARVARGLAPETLLLAVSALVVVAHNTSFWRALLQISGGALAHRLPFLGSVFVAAVLGLTALLGLLTPRPLLKPVLALVLVASALAAYFVDAYGVMINRAMLQSALETDPGEVAELVTPGMLVHVVVLGLIPAVLVACARIRRRSLRRAVVARTVTVVLGIGVLAGSVGSFYRDYVFVAREHRELRYLFNPVNVVSAGVSELRKANHAARGSLQKVGRDARPGAAWGIRSRPALVVLVVGETARAANFSLDGYARETNPELARRDVISFGDVHACGTSTAASVPCMFSHLGAAGGSAAAQRHENLLDVIARSGAQVLWRDNNSGCKGVCARIPTEHVTAPGLPGRCTADECFDEALLDGLQAHIDALTGNALIVLHQKGSHGPAYHLRYPRAFERFKPVCASADVQSCTREQLVNAYDNTILYTDHFLSELIDLLGRNAARFDTAMVYVSDHGESLGERGVYLHGLPRIVAPDEQTRVPMVLWLSPEMLRSTGIDQECLAGRRDAPLTHDYVFSSLLGLMDVATSVYLPDRDLFSPCRRNAASRTARAPSGSAG